MIAASLGNDAKHETCFGVSFRCSSECDRQTGPGLLGTAYPMSTGRNFAELIRSIDSMQLTGAYKVTTPADWQPCEDLIILPAVSDTEAKTLFPDGWETVKPYLRRVPDPN